jgi:transcriptional regulator with XRE-family HTH domain
MPVREMPTIEGQRYGSRLKAMREELGWTREQLAQKAGVDFYDVRALEWGYRMTLEIQAKIVLCLEEAIDRNEGQS